MTQPMSTKYIYIQRGFIYIERDSLIRTLERKYEVYSNNSKKPW